MNKISRFPSGDGLVVGASSPLLLLRDSASTTYKLAPVAAQSCDAGAASRDMGAETATPAGGHRTVSALNTTLMEARMGDYLVSTPIPDLKPGMSVYDYNYGMRRIRAITDETFRYHIEFDDEGFDGWYLRRETLPLEVLS